MTRFLIMLGLAILVIGVLWPYLSRIGLGHLPGDIVVKRDNVTFYFPLMTCLLLSLQDPADAETFRARFEIKGGRFKLAS